MRYGVVLALIGAMGLILGCDEQAADDGAPSIGAVTLPQAGAGAFERVAAFGANPGGLVMYRYTPPNPRPGAPLLVAMHACTQTAAAYRSAGWEPLADAYGFHVLYPEQARGNNGAGCFNWAGEFGDPTNLRRGEGENRSIISMVEHMQARFDIDPARIFATGHSGGAAQTALMLATWPDVFAGGAMIAGIPFDCTTNFNQVSACLNPGLPRPAVQWAQSVFDAFPGFEGRYPKVSVWQGTNDFTVAPVNGTEMVKQWTAVHGLGIEADVGEQVGPHQRSVWFDAAGEAVVESYIIQGGGHGTFIDPDQGCGSVGAFFVDNNICASRRIADFFGLTDDGPVDVPPAEEPEPEAQPEPEPEPEPEPLPGALTVDFVSPADGDTLQGAVVVEVAVSDPAAQVTFTVNGLIIGVAPGAPHTALYNAFIAGEKTLTATATTADGQEAVVSIEVCVGPDCAQPEPEPEPEPEGVLPDPELPDDELPPLVGCAATPGAPAAPVALLLLGLPLLLTRRRAR